MYKAKLPLFLYTYESGTTNYYCGKIGSIEYQINVSPNGTDDYVDIVVSGTITDDVNNGQTVINFKNKADGTAAFTIPRAKYAANNNYVPLLVGTNNTFEIKYTKVSVDRLVYNAGTDFLDLDESFELLIQTPIRESRSYRFAYRSEHPAHPKMPRTARP